MIMVRKEVVIGASGFVLAVIAVVAIVFVWTTVDDVNKRLAAIENKTWHVVGDFMLSPSKSSDGFHIQGEEWRLKFTFNEVNPACGLVIISECMMRTGMLLVD
jgi:hypothetical protein